MGWVTGCSLTRSLTQTHLRSHPNTPTHTNTLTHTHTRTHTLSLSHTHTHGFEDWEWVPAARSGCCAPRRRARALPALPETAVADSGYQIRIPGIRSRFWVASPALPEHVSGSAFQPPRITRPHTPRERASPAPPETAVPDSGYQIRIPGIRSGFLVSDPDFGYQIRIPGSLARALPETALCDLRISICGVGFWGEGYGIRVPGLWVRGEGTGVWVSGYRVWGLGFRV